MKNYSNIILNTLIDKYEGSSLYKGSNTKDIKISFKFTKESIPEYFNEYKSEYNKEIYELCLNLRDRGYIVIQWRKFQEGNIIEKVNLNIDKLEETYKLLNRPMKNNLEKNTIAILNNYCDNISWLGAFSRDMKEKVEAKLSIKKYLDIEDEKSIEDIMYALDKIINVQKETPMRVFSVQIFNDSKKIQRLETKLIRIMIDYGQFDNNEDVLAEANIIKNPSYVYIKGSGVISANGQRIDLEKLGGEIALSSAIIENLEVVSINGRRVLTIENLTTFHTYVPNNELVIYLGGFHNEIRRRFLSKIYEAAKVLPFFHWGDIDLGGFRILNHLREKTGIGFIPLFMDKATLVMHKDNLMAINDEKYIISLRKLLEDSRYNEFNEVICYMLENKVRLEQEIIC